MKGQRDKTQLVPRSPPARAWCRRQQTSSTP